jgi:signal transduction histidine kinase
MSMVERARVAIGQARAAWIAAAGVVAGFGIWGTHFVAMLAYQSGFPVSYDPGLTALSVVIAVGLCSAGIAIALRPGLAAIGGAITGAAIGSMHYVGMAAVRAPADAVWDPVYVISSAVIGIGLMAVGMRYAQLGRGWRRYFTSGLVFTVAICSMHFTGMTAVVYHFDPRVVVPGAVLDPTTLAIAIAASSILVVAMGLVGSLVDHHLAQRTSDEASRMRAHIVELEQTRDALELTSADLTEALIAADAANKTKSAFLAAMSHELRTPLNAVIGFSEIMEVETFGPLGSPKYKQYAHDIHASGAHLLALINDILDLSRLDAGQGDLKDDSVDIRALAVEALRMMATQARTAGVTLINEVSSALPVVTADNRRIRQVLLNLLSNAVKFTPSGGSVTVRCIEDARGLVTSVTDTGIGIAEEDIARAFERFGQVDSTLARKYEGTGLGLPLARELIELHGGTLTLTSTLDVGTTVTFVMPAGRIVRRADQTAA